MTNEASTQLKYLDATATIFLSLRLKDVLDATAAQFAQLADISKAAVFLADNESKSFKLMSARGYAQLSLQEMRVVPFSAEGIFNEMIRTRCPVVLGLGNTLAGFNKAVFEHEQSAGQAAIPLIALDLLVGAVLLDSGGFAFNESFNLESAKKLAVMSAIGIANAIFFGRSEYERERLSALYKVVSSLNENVLNQELLLQKTADAALVLANTPYCAVLLSDPETDQFILAAFKGLDGSSLSEFNLSTEDTLAGKALHGGKTLRLGKNGKEASVIPRAMGGGTFRSVLALPMVHKDHKIGVLMVFSTDETAFHQDHIGLLDTLVSQVSNGLYAAQKHESVLQKVMHDPHTGLLNRFYLQTALQTEIERSKRHKHQLGVLFVDIDYLSRVNDFFGEEKGDSIISDTARIIKETLRKIDLVYRFGGEQFAIILPETPRLGVLEAAERVRKNVKNKMIIPDLGAITVSIGASSYPDQGNEAIELIILAEQALDIAKYQGRDRVVEASFLSSNPLDSTAWTELVSQASIAVSGERQERAKSYLSHASDYANWLIKAQDGKKNKKKNSV